MRCAKCGNENPAGNNFCGQCGGALTLVCAKCNAENSANSRFCGKCGGALKAGATTTSAVNAVSVSPAQTLADAGSLEGERKTVTALFADIKGSMDMMEDLDPEVARAIIDPALNLMIEAVRRYDGYVVQSTGDGIFALFGAPVAHEDHPQRALYAALRMQDEMRRYGDRMRTRGQTPLQVRIGANTGEVVVRSIMTGDGQAEYTPIGHSTSLASRLQTLATPGSVVISGYTRGFVEGYFQLKALGATPVKGVSEPVEIFEVIGLGPLRTRLQRAAGRGFTKFVGREREMEALMHAAGQAKSGHGQIVATMAEPGVGKSRLFFEFKATSQSGWMVLETFSISHGKASAYLPVIDLLRNYFRIATEDDDRTRREKVAGKITILDRSLEDTLPYLFALLGIVEGVDPLAQMDAQIRERRILESVKRIVLRESLNCPLMVIFEDLHWLDSKSQALLNLLADSIGTSKILLLVNYRPEYSHQWSGKTYYTQLRLDPLNERSAEEMLSALLGNGSGLFALKSLITEKTEGNPFFMEEMVQNLFEQGVVARNGEVKLTRSLSDIRIPATVQAMLTARIDRLPAEEKDLLQTLAVVGKEFALSQLKATVQRDDLELERMLTDLQLAEFIYEQPTSGDVEYTFKHALTQEVAYNSVLIERRKLLHERAGAAIESSYPARLEDYFEVLAHHYGHSENTAKAVEYFRRASEQALNRSYHAEAIKHAQSGLTLLAKLPDDADRLRAELALQLAIARASVPVLGYAAIEVGNAFERAAEICRQIGTGAEIFVVVGGLYGYYLVRADHRRADELARELLEIASQEENDALRLEAHFTLGVNLCWQGKFRESKEHLELSLSSFRRDLTLVNTLGCDTPAFTFAYASTSRWVLGFFDQSLARCVSAVRRADEVGHPFTAAASRFNTCLTRILGKSRLALPDAETIIAISAEHGFNYAGSIGAGFRDCALLEDSPTPQIIDELLGIVTGLQTHGATLATTIMLAAVAKGYGRIGKPDEGLSVIDRTLAITEQTTEHLIDAELYRIRGELLLKRNDSHLAEAQTSFERAIEIAREQNAKAWELRATTSLARLLNQQGHRDDAHAMLARIYGWFTEGFDTPDLKDAKALLDELTG